MFQPRLNEHGRPCCFRTLADGAMAFPTAPCDACKAHFAAAAGNVPDPYASGIASLRAAAAAPPTPFESFEAQYIERNRQALAADDAEVEKLRTAHAANPAPRLTAAELDEFAPPDSYALALGKEKR